MGGGMGAMLGRGVIGTVTEVAADHYTIKTEMGEVYTVHFSANTRITKQPAGMRGPGGGGGGQGWVVAVAAAVMVAAVPAFPRRRSRPPRSKSATPSARSEKSTRRQNR